MKIKKQLLKYGKVKPRVYKRWRNLCLIVFGLFSFNYFFNYTVKGVEDLQTEEHENQYGNFLFVDAGITKMEGRNLAAIPKYVEVNEYLCKADKAYKG